MVPTVSVERHTPIVSGVTVLVPRLQKQPGGDEKENNRVRFCTEQSFSGGDSNLLVPSFHLIMEQYLDPLPTPIKK